MNQTQPKNQTAQIRTDVPGPSSRALRAREDAHVAPGLQGYAVMAGIVVAEGRGSAVTDVDGNRYLDFIGGINVNALGHSHPTFVRAMQEQVAEVSVGSFTSRARVELGERLAAAPPAPGRSPAAAVLGRRGGGGERAAAGQVPHREIRVRQLLGRLPRQDDGRAVADGVDVQGQARADGPGRATRSPTRTATAARSASSTRAAASPARRSGASRSRRRARARSPR